MQSVFVSHSTVEKETVQNQIFSRLNLKGLEIHYAEDERGKNKKGEDNLRDVLKKVDWFLVVLSKTSITSHQVRAEVDLAFEQLPVEKILPVLIEDCDPSTCHRRLTSLNSFDFYNDTENGMHQLLNQFENRVDTVDFSLRVMEIFEKVYELDPIERERILDEKAGNDLALRQELEKLLNGKVDADERSFLEESVIDLKGNKSLIGKSVGAFTVIREIATGGMGVIYEARHAHLDRTVALKIPILSHRHIKILSMRLKREGKALAKLRHANVVQVYDAGVTEDEIPFIAMGYIDGRSLDEVVKSEMGTTKQIKKWITQIADALDYLHKEHIVHRDVKPSNIMIDQHDNAILTDFGVAHIGDFARVTVFNPGTPGYMCPEQRMGKPLDGRCDIYSLGLVLYELLTRESPVDPDLKKLPKMTRDQRLLAGVIAKCIRRDPAERYQTGKEMVTAFTSKRRVPTTFIVVGFIGIFIISLFVFVLNKNFDLPGPATATLPTVIDVARPEVIKNLISQSANVNLLMQQLIISRNQGELSFGTEEDFLDPGGCYIFVFENENEPVQAVLAPGSFDRIELLKGEKMNNVSDYLQGKAAIWVSVTG